MRISAAEMASRQRVARMQSRITDALVVDGASYEEVLLALSAALHRWCAENWKQDFKDENREGGKG